MNLKESYQYQNFLKELFNQTHMFLREMYAAKTMRTHYRSRAVDGLNDETVDETTARPFGDIPVDALIGFADAVVIERELLAEAITNAKFVAKQACVDLDATLSANKQRHQLITKLECLMGIKPVDTRKSTQKDFKLNAEGNQTPYYYPAEDVITVDFNRDSVRDYLKQLKALTSERSMKAEKAMLETDVAFEPQFDVNDNYLDALRAFAVANRFMPEKAQE